MNKKVLFVVGSLRENHSIELLLNIISKRLEEKGIETSFFKTILNYLL